MGMIAPRPKLRWFQFSLRTLLVFVTLCAFACSWLAVKLQQAKRQREAAAAVEKLGGQVEWSEPSGPLWLRRLLGDDLFRSVVDVGLGGTEVTDAELEHLKGLDQLQSLNLARTNIAGAGLGNLKGLNQLQYVYLGGTQVTDAGVKKRQQALPNCEIER
ncbi:MAG: hypothetical protein ABSG68_03405 [Thermoguttaceae bacterium]|jgi:hypothetical protein